MQHQPLGHTSPPSFPHSSALSFLHPSAIILAPLGCHSRTPPPHSRTPQLSFPQSFKRESILDYADVNPAYAK